VKFPSGDVVWVAQEYITPEPREGVEPPEDGPVDGLADHDFTTDEEADDNRQEQGEEEGSESVRHARSEGVWRETEISVDQRVRDEVPLHRSAHIKGLDDTLQNRPWAFFFHFFPLAALDEALSMMHEGGQEKWRDFRLDRHLFFTWLGVWFRICADHMRGAQAHWQDGIATAQWFRDTMPWEVFRRIGEVLRVPQYTPEDQEKVDEAGPGQDKFQWFRRWLHASQCKVQSSMGARYIRGD